jgi:hypothetical protein
MQLIQAEVLVDEQLAHPDGQVIQLPETKTYVELQLIHCWLALQMLHPTIVQAETHCEPLLDGVNPAWQVEHDDELKLQMAQLATLQE